MTPEGSPSHDKVALAQPTARVLDEATSLNGPKEGRGGGPVDLGKSGKRFRSLKQETT